MKRVLLVLIAAASAVFASAQIQFGIEAGYNLATLVSSPSESAVTSKSDFNAGVLASVPLFSSCSLQPEIMYSGQGDALNSMYFSAKTNLDYLNIPVLFKYQHSSGLFAETGPQLGFLLSAHQNANGQSVDTRSVTQSTDFSWAFGIGYKLPKGLGIDARYNLGLVNLAKGPYFDGTIKNSVFQFGLFYMFSKL